MLPCMRSIALGVAVAVALGVMWIARPRAAEPSSAVMQITTDARAGRTEVLANRKRFAFAHLPDAAVQVVRLPTGALAAVADRVPGRDRSWGSSLLHVEAGREAVALCDRVFYASRPLPTPTGQILVERGRPGPELPRRMRVDELTIDVVDPRSGAARTLWATTGFEAHLAGLAGDEVIVYLVQPGVASLRAVHWKSGRERVILASIPPYAHDFAVQNGALVLYNRDDVRRDLETIERIDLSNGNRTRVETFGR